MTLLHAVGDAVVGRRDVTLGRHPTESQVRRAAAQCFGIGLDETVHLPNQSTVCFVHAMRVRSMSLFVGAVYLRSVPHQRVLITEVVLAFGGT